MGAMKKLDAQENTLDNLSTEILGKVFREFAEANSTFVVILADPKGKILYCNRSFAVQVNEKPENVVGKNLYDFLVGCDELHNLELIQDLIENHKPLKHYLHIAGKKGLPRTYYFHLFYEQGYVFALGEPEIESLEHAGHALMELNNELVNLHKNKK
jgi:PAS domain-containing protein